MWLKLKMRLGKIVQSALNIFRKKKKYKRGLRAKCGLLEDACEFKLAEGEWTINGTPIEVKLYEPESKEYEVPTLNSYYNQPVTFTVDDCNFNTDALEKLCNTPLTVLPKRYSVKTLIVSTFSNWDYDSIGVDISQLEEKGVAHYFCTSTKSMKEHMEEFRAAHPEADDWEGVEDENASVVVPNATLIEWPGGYWEWDLE